MRYPVTRFSGFLLSQGCPNSMTKQERTKRYIENDSRKRSFMKTTKINRCVWLFGLLVTGTFLFSGCDDTTQPTKTYVWIPSTTFHMGAIPTVNPCPSDYPLSCPGTGKCCASGYPYLCGSPDVCYTTSSSCSGYITCSTAAPLITSVSLSKTSISTGGTWPVFTVDFTVTTSAMITEIIIYVEEVGGYFEMPVSAFQNQDGFIQFLLGLSNAPPDQTTCNNGGKPCYTQIPQGTTNLDEVISLLDSAGNASSTNTEDVPIEGTGGGGGGNSSYCYSTSSCIPSSLSHSCECSGSTSQTQCLSGHPACSAAGGPCGDGTHACCGGETCIYNSCVQGCGQCTGIGCQ